MDDRRFARVLLVTDNADMARIWAYTLRQRGLETITAASWTEAEKLLPEQVPDLTVVDLYQHDRDGADVCRQLRAHGINPVLLVTSIAEEAYFLQAYEAGVDECIQRPLSPLLFLAKTQAWLRRSWTVPTQALPVIQAGPVQLNPETRQLLVEGGTPRKLTNLEFRLLHALMSHRGQVLKTNVLTELVWGQAGGDAAMLKNVVYRLRAKIEPEDADCHWIQTVPGQGYRFQLR